MPVYMAVGFDRRPMDPEAREGIRAEHRAYVLDNVEPILSACALLERDGSQCGSLYFFEAESVEAVHAWFADEPFAASHIYESLQVREIDPGALWTMPSRKAQEDPKP